VPALLEKAPSAPRVPRGASGRGGGRDPGGGGGRHGGERSRFRREWPLPLAVVVVVLLAALLTWLGMYTQIRANLAGAQLPGA
jgi:hypothetical protein